MWVYIKYYLMWNAGVASLRERRGIGEAGRQSPPTGRGPSDGETGRQSQRARSLAPLLPPPSPLPLPPRPQDGLAAIVKRNPDGTVKTMVRSAPFIQIPLGVTEDRLLGTVDIEVRIRRGGGKGGGSCPLLVGGSIVILFLPLGDWGMCQPYGSRPCCVSEARDGIESCLAKRGLR